MDNLTHSLFGAVLARSGLAQRYGRGTTALLVVASNVPDVDVLLMATHPESSAWLRRTHTHCVLGAPLVALLLGVAWWAATRRRLSLPAACGLALLGAGGHVVLDLLNSYGVVALWPFSHERFELAWVYIIDLAFTGILAASLVLGRVLRGRLPTPRVNQAGLLVLAAYVACCAAGRERSRSLVRAGLEREGARVSVLRAFPEALGPHRWRVAAREGDRWRMWLVHVLDGRLELVRDVRTEADDPAVRRVRETGRGRSIEAFFAAPVWVVDRERGEVRCFDLRFVSAIFERGNPFTYSFPLEAPP